MAVGDSKTLIANLALSHMHSEGKIENIEIERTAEAKAANLWYDRCRRLALADMDLGFARRRSLLAAHGDDPSADWAFRYIVPADLIQARYIEHPAGRDQEPVLFVFEHSFTAGTPSILTDAQAATMVYSWDIQDPTLFPPHFVLAVSYLLAHFIAGPLSGKRGLKAEALTNYNNSINLAGAHEANVTTPGTAGSPLPGWITDR